MLLHDYQAPFYVVGNRQFLNRHHHLGGDALRRPFLRGMIVQPLFAVALFTHHDGAGRGEMRHSRRLIVAQKQVEFHLQIAFYY